MNFLDTYDLTRSTTPNPNDQPAAEQPSLNEEVNQVIGQLGRFWGGFRKQSQTALQAARKDLSEVVVQAQKELSKFTAAETPQETPETSTSTTTAEGSSSTPAADADASAERDTDAATPKSTADSAESTSAPSPPATRNVNEPSTSSSSSLAATGSSLFSRLQSALPPNIVATVQSNIAQTTESLKHASETIDLQGLRTNLLSELQRVQGLTLAQAEEYAHKSEALLREAVREAGDVLRDAVKVLPPDEANAGQSSVGNAQGLVWDGADMWMMPSEDGEGSHSRAMSEGSSRSLSKSESQSAVATRAEALLRRLRQDPDILRHDPEAEEGVKERYVAWKKTEVDALEGGVEGAEWKARVTAALEEPVDGQALKQLEQTLVPSELSESAFWLRFFFRTYQIRSEEEKRKALLQSTADNDEDFSWEDEDDDDAPVTKDAKPTTSTQEDNAASKAQTLGVPAPKSMGTPGTNTPRVSSEDSFDLVSSSNVSVAGDEKKAEQKAGTTEDDDGDSDWE